MMSLSTASARAFDRLAADLARVFGSRLEAVIAYGRSRALVFVRTLDRGDLDACSALEDRPGKKNHERMRVFINTVRGAAP